MTEEITNRMLLEHMQAMKYELLQRIGGLDGRVGGLEQRMGKMEQNTATLAERVRLGFEEARLHRQALQEDLEATMRMLFKHDKKLARM